MTCFHLNIKEVILSQQINSWKIVSTLMIEVYQHDCSDLPKTLWWLSTKGLTFGPLLSLMNLLIISQQYNELFIQSHSDATGQHVIKTAQLSWPQTVGKESDDNVQTFFFRAPLKILLSHEVGYKVHTCTKVLSHFIVSGSFSKLNSINFLILI